MKYFNILDLSNSCHLNSKKDSAVLIGRFQPFHEEHLRLLRNGLMRYKKILVILGSANSPLNSKNPFTVEEREKMIRISLSEVENDSVLIRSIIDFVEDKNWVKAIKKEAYNKLDSSEITLLGCSKDKSSYYLQLFPEWNLDLREVEKSINSTDIRYSLFKNWNKPPQGLPELIYTWITKNISYNSYCNRYSKTHIPIIEKVLS